MHCKILFIIGCILLGTPVSMAQPGSYPVGARAIGMGHTSLVNKDFWAVCNNQAAAAYITGIELAVFMENRYLIKEMNRIVIGGAFGIGKGGIFANVDHFGDHAYSEMKAGAGYALQLGEHFAAGLQLDYLRMSIGEGYGSYHAFTFEGGIYAMITDKISLGIHCFNPVNAGWTHSKEKLPVIIRGGIGFRPEASISISAEVLKSTAEAAVIAAGCEYRYRDKFFIRAGITSGPARYTFGAGFKLKKLMIDIASSVHSFLGYSPQLSIIYIVKE